MFPVEICRTKGRRNLTPYIQGYRTSFYARQNYLGGGTNTSKEKLPNHHFFIVFFFTTIFQGKNVILLHVTYGQVRERIRASMAHEPLKYEPDTVCRPQLGAKYSNTSQAETTYQKDYHTRRRWRDEGRIPRSLYERDVRHLCYGLLTRVITLFL